MITLRRILALLVGLPLALQSASSAYQALALSSAERGQDNAAAAGSASTRLAVLREPELATRLSGRTGQVDLAALARGALAEGPLNPQAFWVLGYVAKAGPLRDIHIGPHTATADALFGAGSALSRRHAGIALEALRSSAQGGDLKASLVALDRLLLVNPEHSAQLELLAGQLGDPGLREALVPYARRPWFGVLLRGAAREQGDAGGAAILITGSGLGADELAPGLLSALLARLVATGDVSGAQTLAARMGARLSPGPTGFGLGGQGTDQRFVPLAWRIDEPAMLGGSGDKAAVSAELLPGVSAVLLERVTGYPPGTYRLSLTVSGDGLAERPPLRWELECLEGRSWQRRWDQAIPAGAGLQRYAMSPSWTSACTVQRWRLRAGPVEDQLGATLHLSDVALEKAT